MCGREVDAPGDGGAQRATPRLAEGAAVDPITLEPVDEVTITTLVDNSYDALMGDMGPAKRMPMGRTPRVASPLFEEGDHRPGPRRRARLLGPGDGPAR